MDNKSIRPDAVKNTDGKPPKTRYTEQQLKDAETFLDSLKKIPDSEYEAGRLLVLGFMSALDKKNE